MISTTRASGLHLAPIFGSWKFSELAPRRALSPLELHNIWEDEFSRLKLARNRDPASPHYQLDFGHNLLVDLYPDDQLIVSLCAGQYPDFEDFLLEQILPRALAYEGHLIVHAGGVMIDGKAVLMVGGSGHGKSTLVASFFQANFPLLGDDAMVVSWQADRPFVKSTHPSLRLLPDSIAQLCPVESRSSVVVRSGGKRRMQLAEDHLSRDGKATPIAMLIALAKRPSEEISLRRLNSAESCILLLENSFSLDPTDLERARGRLNQASAVANRVPAFELSYPRDYSRLPDVRRTIVEGLQGEFDE